MVIKGIGVCEGISIGKVFKYDDIKLEIEKREVTDIKVEIDRLEMGLRDSIRDLEHITDRTIEKIDKESAAIFESHIQLLKDQEMIGRIQEMIQGDKVNVEYAIDVVSKEIVQIFESMDNEYMRERAADIKDITKRLQKNILGVNTTGLSEINEPVIIVAYDLTPADTVIIDKKFVKGFITDIGGRTSHTAIMARTLGIPTIVGSKVASTEINVDDKIILDGFCGDVIVNPDEDTLLEYKGKLGEYSQLKSIWDEFKNKETMTKDGFQVEIAGNIGELKDTENILLNGGEGIGLFRTEFLYMGSEKLPTEDEQFECYKKVLESMNGKSVVIRTLDIGGDKELPYLELDKEMNPFLGHRAVRLCLKEKEIFKTQLRALLRASIYGNLKIMIPMIATINELREVKELLNLTKYELHKENVEISEKIELGIMIEIPSAAMIADQLAKEVDFFSIGTNDLIQYLFAADRMNDNVSYLYQPYNPSLLRIIKMVIDAAHREGKWVGMCGEVAGDQYAIPILIGLGLDEFSMSPSSILKSRHLISKLEKERMKELAEEALKMSTNEEVYKLIDGYFKDNNINREIA